MTSGVELNRIPRRPEPGARGAGTNRVRRRGGFRFAAGLVLLPAGLAAADDDPLPPATGPRQPPPSDWMAWAGVGRLRGESEAQVETTYDWSGTGIVTSHQEHAASWASVHFELELDAEFQSHPTRRVWRVVAPVGRGGENVTWRKVGPRTLNTGESSGVYAGPMSLRTRPGLQFDLRTGRWEFVTLGEPGGAWTVSTRAQVEDFNRAEDVTDTVPGRSLETAAMNGVAPRALTTVSGTLRVDLSSGPGAGGRGPGVTNGGRVARVNFWPEWDDIEVRVEIERYEKWLPRGNLEHPDQPGPAPLVISARLQPKATRPAPAPVRALPPVRRFRFELSGTSREPGVCMNWPVFGAGATDVPREDPEPDLRFTRIPGTDTVLSPRRQKAGVRPVPDPSGRPTGRVQVDCYDFGAHASLRVIAELEDGREVAGYLAAPDGPRYTIKLPDRTDGSLVARVWREREKVTAADATDEDAQPKADGQNGDGFSIYEEYRGFRYDTIHLRLKPDRKDLFVANRIGPAAEPGFELFMRGTARGSGKGFAVHHHLRPEELPASREINANRSARSPRVARETQHALVVVASAGGDASQADFDGKEDTVAWRPKNVVAVRILAALADARDFKSTIAHELSHAIGARHHGENDLGRRVWERVKVVRVGAGASFHFREWPAVQHPVDGYAKDEKSGGTRIRIFREDGSEIDPNASATALMFARVISPWVAQPGGQHSGMQECWLRYDLARAHVPRGRNGDRVLTRGYDVSLDDEPPGLDLCEAPAGTGVNDPAYNQNRPRYGPATRGKCYHQLCVRDDAPDRQQGS